ncbi:MAG: hypothetical protein ACI8Y4_004030 [Candidatus Poriferisodalaceae bacterium]|jgi:hypothetical protein
MLGSLEFVPIDWAERGNGEIAEAIGRCDSSREDAARLFFHGYASCPGTSPQASNHFVVQFSDAQASHSVNASSMLALKAW